MKTGIYVSKTGDILAMVDKSGSMVGNEEALGKWIRNLKYEGPVMSIELENELKRIYNKYLETGNIGKIQNIEEFENAQKEKWLNWLKDNYDMTLPEEQSKAFSMIIDKYGISALYEEKIVIEPPEEAK